MMGAEGVQRAAWFGFMVALFYAAVSTGITLVNKAVFTYDFNGSNALTAAQMLVALVLLYFMKLTHLVEYKDFNWQTAKQVYPLSFFFIAMVVTGLAALRFVNVPMYGALRRGTTWIVMLGEQLILGKSYPMDEAFSVHIMIAGAFIGSIGDLGFNLWGYFLTLLNCVVTALYLIYIPKKQKESGLNQFGLMFYNNLFSLPMVALIAYVFEWESLKSFKHWSSIGFQFSFISSALAAFALNYLIFLCSTVNSPLTTSITGQLKNIVQTVLGLFLFGDIVPTRLLYFGIFVSSAASIWYGIVKYQQQTEKERSKVEPPAIPLTASISPNTSADGVLTKENNKESV